MPTASRSGIGSSSWMEVAIGCNTGWYVWEQIQVACRLYGLQDAPIAQHREHIMYSTGGVSGTPNNDGPAPLAKRENRRDKPVRSRQGGGRRRLFTIYKNDRHSDGE